jgi:Metallo-beta-lactamase superfamily
MPPTTQKNPPRADEIEVSIFGPGFGESVVVHAGEGRWFVIDSCLDRRAGKPKPSALLYFDEICVDPATSVDLILATHWHDDHVAGIDQVVQASPNAKFWCSDALRSDEFLALLDLRLTRRDIKFSSGADYISRVVDLIGPSFNFAIGGMRLHQQTLIISGISIPVEVWSLSPSQYESFIAKRNLGTLVTGPAGPQTRIPDRNPNHASVVSAVLIGNCHILLGADLEEPGDSRLGWSAVLSNPGRPRHLQATVFKVPHHGSVTAHHDGIWRQLIASVANAAVTPWTLGNNLLPRRTDVDRICQLASAAYVTTNRAFQRPRRRSNLVQNLVPASLRAMPKVPGHIRFRRPITAGAANWDVSLFDGADRLQNFQN